MEKSIKKKTHIYVFVCIYPEGNQPLIFIVKTGAEAEAPTVWPPDMKS